MSMKLADSSEMRVSAHGIAVAQDNNFYVQVNELLVLSCVLLRLADCVVFSISVCVCACVCVCVCVCVCCH